MSMYWRVAFIALSSLLIIWGGWMKVYHIKCPMREFYKDWKRYSNYNFLFFTLFGLGWLTLNVVNVLNGFEYLRYVMIVVILIPFAIDAKYGKIKLNKVKAK
ncbi:hypothetical protein [uncultured Clostridium sp.]|uniref:hypothetical protein n=1 Tax=uncultured Clostridium sp. TaxID=59620 RepID=UPI00260A6EFB|nr:hypothetical protein [uncultured Clostridium sp.]